MTVRLPSRAIILAAGRGRRLGALTRHRPKCLLPLGGERMLERQLRLLSDVGLVNVAVVVGWQGHQIEDAFGDAVTIFRNPNYQTTGSVHSLQVAADFLSGDVVILNSDLVYTARMLPEMCAPDRDCVLALHPHRRYTANVGTQLSGCDVSDVGRHIPPSHSTGVFSGAALVRGGATDSFRDAVLRCDPLLTRSGWSMAFATMIREGHRVGACLHDGPVFDVNSVAAYAAAKAYVASGSAATVMDI